MRLLCSLLSLCFLGAVFGLDVQCRQSQLPEPLLRVSPTAASLNLQTVVPDVPGAVFGTNPGAWRTEQVRNGNNVSVGIYGYDLSTLVYFFTFEMPFELTDPVQKIVDVTSSSTGPVAYTKYSYTDWLSCNPAAGNVQIASKAWTGVTQKGAAVITALISQLGAGASQAWNSAPDPTIPQLTTAAIATPDQGAAFNSWEISWYGMRLPLCNSSVNQRNTNPRSVITLSVVPTALVDISSNVGRESSLFAWKDLSKGNAVASVAHITAQYCDKFFTQAPKPLDVLFAIDNSQSMDSWQQAVSELGDAIAAILTGAGIDWRIGLVTSSHWDSVPSCIYNDCVETYKSSCRFFTQDINAVKKWLGPGNVEWIGAGGACGSSREELMYSVQLITTPSTAGSRRSFMPFTTDTVAATAPRGNFRISTNGLVIYLGDADDQKAASTLQADLIAAINAYTSYFTSLRSQFNGGLYMAGILCPDSLGCGETQYTPRVMRSTLRAYPGAVTGDITNVASIQKTIQDVFNAIVAVSSPYVLSQRSAIGASVQVILSASDVLGPCNNTGTNIVPRSRINGWDIEQNTVILFGGCRPAATGRALVVNYYYWVITQCGDGIVQTDGVTGEQCDPPGPCCDSFCKFAADGTSCPAGGCGNSSNTCQNGFCTSVSCPDWCVACGETGPNYCTVTLGCTGGVCQYANRTCLPINCNKRNCIRTVNNSLIPGLMGECVLATAEQGFICDTDFCILDACGWCNGDNSTCRDCAGNINGVAALDLCGLCGGDSSTCCSCLPGQQTVCSPDAPKFDICNVCGGNGLSCIDCALGTGGARNLDACGVCNGDGTSCLPTYAIQVNFQTAPTSTSTCDDCCQIMNSINASLMSLGYTPNVNTLTCTDKLYCNPTIDPLCFNNQNPPLHSYLIEIQQVLFIGATLTNAAVADLLQTSGQVIGSSVYGLNLVGSGISINAPSGPVSNVTGTTASPGSTGGSPVTTVSPSPPSPPPAVSGGGASPTLVTITFTSAADFNGLTQSDLNAIGAATLQQLLSGGQLTGSASDYVVTVVKNSDGTNTLVVSIVPVAATYPGGGTTSPVPVDTNVPLTIPQCINGCSASVTPPPATSAPASSEQASAAPALACALALLAL